MKLKLKKTTKILATILMVAASLVFSKSLKATSGDCDAMCGYAGCDQGICGPQGPDGNRYCSCTDSHPACLEFGPCTS